MTDFRSRDQPRKPKKKFSPYIFSQGFPCKKPFVAILSSSPSQKRPNWYKFLEVFFELLLIFMKARKGRIAE
jgi:hypothetical protein